jgi:hypothetical protein
MIYVSLGSFKEPLTYVYYYYYYYYYGVQEQNTEERILWHNMKKTAA